MPDKHDKLAWALELAARNFMIHPLPVDGKAPALGYSWKNVRTTDPARIKQWFADNPNMNYGVSPGSGGVIIDLDQGKTKSNGRVTDGLNNFFQVEAENPELVWGHTFTVKSPSSGYHLYLLTKEPVTNYSGFGQDIDVRGEGGYVVGPGCYYDGMEKAGDKAGYYEVVDDQPFMQAPPWVVQRCRAEILNTEAKADLVELDLPSNINQAKLFLTKCLPAIEGMAGTGDLHTYKTACVLCHNYALSGDVALDLMANYKFHLPTDPEGYEGSWNDRSEPPWDVYGMGNECLERKVRNADEYGKMRRGEMSGAVMLQGLDIEVVAQAEAAAIQAVEDSDSTRRRLTDHLLRGADIFDRLRPPRWIIPFWLPGDGLTGIVGESGMGKSTVLLDLALTLAHDMRWQDTPTRKGMKVIYTCGEDYHGSSLQIRAWCRSKGIAAPDTDRFVFIPEVPPLASVDEVNLWIEVFKDEIGTKDVAVFIDTWQRATCGLSQNDEREMQGAVNAAEALGRAVRGPVVVAFHSPKSNRDTIAGWEGQRNTSNALWFLEKDARGVKLEARKVRCAPTSNYLVLEYKEYDTGLSDEYFRFNLKHVVPNRLGGTRITEHGETYTEENLSEAMKAIAWTLYWLETRRKDDTSANGHYTLKHAAERIVGSPDHNTFGRPPLVDMKEPWAVELVDNLKAAKLVFPMSLATMQGLIQKTLGHAGYDLGDGRVIRQDGGKILIDNGGLTV